MFDQDATATVYGPADIRICQGTANVDCSASTTGMDLDAHKYYFEHISGCGSDSLEFKRSEPEDAELLQRISAFAEMDRRPGCLAGCGQRDQQAIGRRRWRWTICTSLPQLHHVISTIYPLILMKEKKTFNYC